MQRANLIKLNHVAKRKLALDDDTYRAFLSGVVSGKTSCRAMRISELEAVLKALEERGFKKTKLSRPQPKAAPVVTDKIRVIWLIMRRQGFVFDGTDTALNAFVKRTTSIRNGGEGVARLEWLRGDQASTVLESLKRWHMRCMQEKLPAKGYGLSYERTCDLYRKYSL